MKKLSLLLIALCSAMAISAVPTFDLMGGTMPSGVPVDNNALFVDYKADVAAYYNSAYSPDMNQIYTGYVNSGIITLPFFTSTTVQNGIQPWKWLGDYIKVVVAQYSLPSGSTYQKGLTEAYQWRAHVEAFFLKESANTASSWNGHASFSTAGKPAYWQLAYMIGHNLQPTRENSTFLGWYTTKNTSGTKITSVSQLNRSGTVYAVWQKNSETVWDYQGGYAPFVVDSKSTKGDTIFEINTNEELWELFMADFRPYAIAKVGREDFDASDITSKYFTETDNPVAAFMGKDPDGNGNAWTTTTFDRDVVTPFLTDAGSKWKWLGDYIKKYYTPSDGTHWRYEVQGFFMKCSKSSSADVGGHSYIGYDWTNGKAAPSAWLPSYKLNYPPIKHGYEFKGWYTAASGGTKCTTLDEVNLYARVYARWEKSTTDPNTMTFTTFDVILPKDSVHAYVVTPTATTTTANVDNITWSCSPTGALEITQGTGINSPYSARVKGLITGPAKLTITKTLSGGSTLTATKDIWVATNPIAGREETAQIGLYAFKLDLKYHEDTKVYDFKFSTNAALDAPGRIIVALESDVKDYGWNTELLPRCYQRTIPKADIPSKGAYTVTIAESDLQAVFINEMKDDAAIPSANIVWAVELAADNVSEYAVFRTGILTDGETGVVASNDDPETVDFGRLYGYFKGGTQAGAYSYNPLDMSPTGITSTHIGGNWQFGNIGRIALDSHGRLYITDKSNTNPGIYVGIVDENHVDRMSVYPFFPKDKTTVTVTDGDYPIIKDEDGKEVGCAFLAADTYVREINGKQHAILFAYAKGHSQTASEGKTWEKNGIIPYHSIVQYDMGEINTGEIGEKLSIDFTQVPKIDKVFPIEGNVHSAHTANIIATSKGVWVVHDRTLNNNNSYSTSLQFYGANGCTYSSASDLTGFPGQSDVNKYINGSVGGAFAVNKDNTLLIMQDAQSNFIVFNVTWNGDVPTLRVRDVYHHNLGTINQMELDYAGNLLCSGNRGLSIVTIPDVYANNKHLTPCNSRYILSRMHQYDCIFTGAVDNSWSNINNWMYEYYPDATSDVRIGKDVIIDTDAEAHGVYMVAEDGTHSYAELTVAEGESLTVADKICWVDNGDPKAIIGTISNPDDLQHPYITVKSNAALTYTELCGAPYADVSVKGTAVVTNGVPEWQQTAVPFNHNEAAEDFYGASMHAWDEANSGWASLGGWGNSLHRFKGYMMTQLAAKEYVMRDKLEATHSPQKINLSYKGDKLGDDYVKGLNLVGNSWVSPIQLQDLVFTQDNTEASVYIYQKAVDKKGQYAAWPANQPNPEFETIAPLQAFFVRATGDNASVTLNYHHPLASAVAQHEAPRRAAEMDMPNILMKIDVAGEKAGEGDELYIFESAKYSYDFDNGYESTKMEGDAGTPYLAATTAFGELAVLATPTFEGTMINFRQGLSTQYTFTFDYAGEEVYYLEDVLTGYLTEIRTGNSYFFTVTDDDSGRFRIVRKADQGNETTSLTNVWAADNKLFLENPLGEEVEVRVFSADGKMVQATTTTNRTLQLHVPITGVYTVQLRTNDTVQTIKCIL